MVTPPPHYIQPLLSINQPPRPLRSGDKMYKLNEHRWKLKSKAYHFPMLRYPAIEIAYLMLSETSNWS